jgi:phosphoribosylaminoimidazole synthetase/phosphoribosylamine--glycine ligase
MKFLIVGCGGREYAIIKSLKNTIETENDVFCIGDFSNPGITSLISVDNYKLLEIVEDNFKFIANYCNKYKIDYVFIGPEKPLNDGLVDYLMSFDIKCIGPSKLYAQIETDKSFARQLMEQYNMSQYNPKVFESQSLNSNSDVNSNANGTVNDTGNININFNRLKTFYETSIKKLNYDYVIKPVGLCGGKGVKIYKDHFTSHGEGLLYCNELLTNGMNFLLEERLIGKEFSLLSFCDGKTLIHMPPLMDFKRAYNNNKGPNTGSMGCISCANHSLPFLSDGDLKEAQSVNESVITALTTDINKNVKEEYGAYYHMASHGYRGILYGSFILTKQGLKVIEFNARFGDPECINLMKILDIDLDVILEAMAEQRLHIFKDFINFKPESTLMMYLVPNGYPDNPVRGEEIHIDIESNDILKKYKESLVYASLYERDNKLFLKGSRALGIVLSSSINEIENLNQLANKIAEQITGPIQYRTDIGITSLSYQDCGVDINNVSTALESASDGIKSTFNDNVIQNYGGFGGLISLDHICKEGHNTLVTSIDGVGTKTSFLPTLFGDEAYYIMGQDIVGHSINDILVQNAKPLFFMDYVASSKIEKEKLEQIIAGMVSVCKEHDCVLIGGETAEMPGVYHDNSYDIVGTMIGSVNSANLINGKEMIQSGDVVIALPSNNIHTNGFSMIRKIFEDYDIQKEPHLIEWMRAPHKPYYHEIIHLLENNMKIHGLCHITGGGLIDNPPRILPEHLKMNLEYSFEDHPMFKRIKELGNISNQEMYRTFNCGIGMMVVVPDMYKHKVMQLLRVKFNIYASQIGTIVDKTSPDEKPVSIKLVTRID